MPPFNPEAIEVALFNLIENAVSTQAFGFETISRKARIWANMPPPAQPSVFLIPRGGKTGQDKIYGLSRYVLSYVVLIYGRGDSSPDKDAPAPQTLLNNAWAAIDAAMRNVTPPGSPQTLGSLAGVVNAWIEGDVPMESGVLDQQCAIEIPISVICGI